MAKLKQRLAALLKSLDAQKALRARARRRTKADHERAEKAERQRDHVRQVADGLRMEGHTAKARRKDKKAFRLGLRAQKMHNRAGHWAGVAKALHARVEGIDVKRADLAAEIDEFERKHRTRIVGNKAVGGNDGKRWLAYWAAMVLNCSRGVRRNFYSQPGGPDIWHEIEPGPAFGCRSDCSSSITGAAWGCDLPDPNGLDFSGLGFTGTLIGEHNGWRRVSLEHLRRKGWGYIVYGDGSGFHVEAFTPAEGAPDRTSGHGDAAVNHGTVHLFGSGTTERYYSYDPS